MLNSAFDAFTDVRTDYYPAELRADIDRINDLVYATINNGVTAPASPPSKGPTKKRHALCLLLSIRSKIGCRGSVI
jgi:hypothetical protein